LPSLSLSLSLSLSAPMLSLSHCHTDNHDDNELQFRRDLPQHDDHNDCKANNELHFTSRIASVHYSCLFCSRSSVLPSLPVLTHSLHSLFCCLLSYFIYKVFKSESTTGVSGSHTYKIAHLGDWDF
jgi:hypothetical protein